MATPQLEAAAASTRTESVLRALLRTKLLAWDAVTNLGMRNVANLTEDQRIDLEFERRALWKTYEAACLAIHEYERKQVAA